MWGLLLLFLILGRGRAQFGAPGDITWWRQSGTALSPPLDMLMWLKADAITGYSDGQSLSNWVDSGPFSFATTNAGTTARPVYVASGLNGKPVVSFNATNSQFFDLPQMFTNETAAELFVVLKINNDPPTSTRYGQWRFAGAGDVNAYPFTDSVIYDGFCATLRLATGNPGMSLTNWHLYNTSSTTASWISRTNGVQHFATAVNVFTNGVGGTMGTARRIGQSGGASAFLNGHIAEVILYGRILSAGERTTVHDYIEAKYGITLP